MADPKKLVLLTLHTEYEHADEYLGATWFPFRGPISYIDGRRPSSFNFEINPFGIQITHRLGVLKSLYTHGLLDEFLPCVGAEARTRKMSVLSLTLWMRHIP